MQYDPAASKEPATLLDAASRAAIEVVVSQLEPPPALRHLLLPPIADVHLPNQISLSALKAIAECSGNCQLLAQQFLTKWEGLWGILGGDFVSQIRLRQYLGQLMPAFHLSSIYAKAAIRSYLERKLRHAKATLDEHAQLKFVVGRQYNCVLPAVDSTGMTDSVAPRMEQCLLLRHLDGEYEVDLIRGDQERQRVKVKTLFEISVAPVDDCDWSDEAYARDSPQVLSLIAADFPSFQMVQRKPNPQSRVSWPIKFYHPPGSNIVRSKMDFDEVDYGISFMPFMSEAMLPSLTDDRREWLVKTVCS